MAERNRPSKVSAIAGLGEIADRYDAILCDIWGVLHNGRAAFAAASEALVAYRRRGGAVVLISNAPRPNPPIREQVLRFGTSPLAFDAVITSGDVSIALIAERIGEPVLHIGPARDLSLIDAAAKAAGRQPRLVGLEDAAYILCTGLYDDSVETPADYEDRLRAMAGRGLVMICANPDLVVHRGGDLLYCAGALASRFEELGGAVVYAGKPHAPIYAGALALAARARGVPLTKSRVLAIGDGMRTDIAGASAAGIDALFVTQGIHRDGLHDGETAAVIPALQP